MFHLLSGYVLVSCTDGWLSLNQSPIIILEECVLRPSEAPWFNCTYATDSKLPASVLKARVMAKAL